MSDQKETAKCQGLLINISEKGARMLGKRLMDCEANESLSVEVGEVNLLFKIK